ncbi:MAG: lysylphosphatidylglycerol synthase transmembrane domain-containing protein [Desulfatiglans sp.]|jgi:uncharacterized protein (TIRG00374 family)|nr:lysylphosphatidylglycerol synthase transmembrane domain-containing protein [Thermodesulfobacteriota bacterium]MEE4352726.1 lysylphosphatidylglycerol synthase transmembrane domain-containing protein [Desulfatiglans sp.]
MKKAKKTWIYHLIGTFAGLGIIAALVFSVGWQHFLEALRDVSFTHVLLALFIYGLSWLPRTLRLKFLAVYSGTRISSLDLFRVNISGYALNTILPAKMGDIASIGFLKMKGMSFGRAAAVIIQTRILDLAAISFLTAPVLLITLGRSSPSWILVSLIVCTTIVFAAASLALLDKNKMISSFLKKLSQYPENRFLFSALTKISRAYNDYHELASNRRLLVPTLLLSLFIWMLEGATCVVFLSVMEHRLTVLPPVLAVLVANIGKSVPSTPGGVGIYETVAATVLLLQGIPIEAATAVGILDHATKKLFNLAIGLPSAAAIGGSIFTARETPHSLDL